MKILIVCSGNAKNFSFEKNQAFVFDQVEILKRKYRDIEFEYFFIKGKGMTGYFNQLKDLKRLLQKGQFHCIHAHFVFSGLLANLQRKVPVITTFHGSDINLLKNRIVSFFVAFLSKRNIYVSSKLMKLAMMNFANKSFVIPCGVDLELFREKPVEREMMNLSMQKKYILFASNFENPIKNYPLAKAAIDYLNDTAIELLPLKNYSREEVSKFLNVVDLALMTSFTEGSPQFVKEAIACKCPVVSTDVGDVKEMFSEIEGCFISTFDYLNIAQNILKGLSFGRLKNEIDEKFDNHRLAEKIYELYRGVKK